MFHRTCLGNVLYVCASQSWLPIGITLVILKSLIPVPTPTSSDVVGQKCDLSIRILKLSADDSCVHQRLRTTALNLSSHPSLKFKKVFPHPL